MTLTLSWSVFLILLIVINNFVQIFMDVTWGTPGVGNTYSLEKDSILRWPVSESSCLRAEGNLEFLISECQFSLAESVTVATYSSKLTVKFLHFYLTYKLKEVSAQTWPGAQLTN